MDVNTSPTKSHTCRKWIGAVWLMIEMNILTTNIFGFPALFKVLPKYGVYANLCPASNNTDHGCIEQTQQYQNALTLGIILFNVPSIFVGLTIDKFGCRFTKLIGVLFHIIGWLALAFVQPGYDALLYVHTAFISLAGIIVQITGYATCNYFSKSRVVLLTLYVGLSASANIWYSVFQVVVDNNQATLYQFAYIWLSFAALLILSSFLFLDWKFPFLNLPYQFDTELEQKPTATAEEAPVKVKWVKQICQRTGIWEHLTNPLYVLLVLFLAFLMMPTILLSVTWYPWVYYLNNNDKTIGNSSGIQRIYSQPSRWMITASPKRMSADEYTFAFNIASLSSILLCSLVGFLIGFRTDHSQRNRLFNLSLIQTGTWLLNITVCIVSMFASTRVIIPALIFYYLARSAIAASTQAVVSLFFPSKYIGTLIGMMWTVTGIITCIQYGLVKLTVDVSRSWTAWVIVLVLVLLMSCHWIHLWLIYYREVRKSRLKVDDDLSTVKTF